MSASSTRKDLFTEAWHCLQTCDPDAKLAATHVLAGAWVAGEVDLHPDAPVPALDEPGRPPLPHLVPPREVPRRRFTTPIGRATLIHALAHIEFNAINLALDAVVRFRDLPRDYYSDWLRVADEEAQHFALLRERLRTLGYDYGAFDAHNGLWEMAEKTAHDVLMRMALVPRVLEARGLDVTPAMMERLRAVGDTQSAGILEIILRDEVGHVAIGTRWFRYVCNVRGLDPDATFAAMLERFLGEMNGRIQGPFHVDARERAGFSRGEMDYLARIDDDRRN